LDLAIDLRLVPPLAPLWSGGMMEIGAMVMARASSLTYVLSGDELMGCGISPKLNVELEPVYRASSLLVIASLGCYGMVLECI
jgi:hypothetical protein